MRTLLQADISESAPWLTCAMGLLQLATVNSFVAVVAAALTAAEEPESSQVRPPARSRLALVCQSRPKSLPRPIESEWSNLCLRLFHLRQQCYSD